MLIDIEVLKGQIINQVLVIKDTEAVDSIVFVLSDGRRLKMFHDKDCCEHVFIKDIAGSFYDLIGVPVLLAECVTNSEDNKLDDDDKSFTWTFYKLATISGEVNISWYGTSHGYYSEAVDFEWVDEF